MSRVYEKSGKNSLHIIRVRPEFHHLAKIAASKKLLTLQVWTEQLIEKETKKNKPKES